MSVCVCVCIFICAMSKNGNRIHIDSFVAVVLVSSIPILIMCYILLHFIHYMIVWGTYTLFSFLCFWRWVALWFTTMILYAPLPFHSFSVLLHIAWTFCRCSFHISYNTEYVISFEQFSRQLWLSCSFATGPNVMCVCDTKSIEREPIGNTGAAINVISFLCSNFSIIISIFFSSVSIYFIAFTNPFGYYLMYSLVCRP